MDKYLITGGCGFIGSNLIHHLLKSKKNIVLNIDKLTKASSLESLYKFKKNKNYIFKKINICNYKILEKEIYKFKPKFIIHLAAESHVDNSIINPKQFINTNIVGTFNILQILVTNNYFKKNNVRFLHVSTDEVYGSLNKNDISSIENSPLKPNSPYSSSKASSDMLVRAWHKTYGLYTITTHCCNNFGPWQNPEKLIPKIIYNSITRNKIPIYGNGKNIREWIHVKDHVRILEKILKISKPGEVYNIGSGFEIDNLKLANIIIKIVNDKLNNNISTSKLIEFVKNRKGHDFRYSINSKKITKIVGPITKNNIIEKINETIVWYINNQKWLNKKTK